MKITTTIKQTISQLIDQMKTSENWKFRKSETRDNIYYLDDTEFNSSAEVKIEEFEIKIYTAWSSYVYVFRAGEDNLVHMTYIGALRGYRRQFLMPHFTPTYETKCISSEAEGVLTLQEAGLSKIRKALKHYPNEGAIGKINNLLDICFINRTKINNHFAMPNLNEVCNVDVKIEGYPFPTKKLTWIDLANTMELNSLGRV